MRALDEMASIQKYVATLAKEVSVLEKRQATKIKNKKNVCGVVGERSPVLQRVQAKQKNVKNQCTLTV